MDDESTTTTFAQVATTGNRTPTGSLLLALFVCWLRPAAWAPRTDRVSLRLAFLIHVLAGIGVLIASLSIDPFSEWLRREDCSMLHLFLESVWRFLDGLERHPTRVLLVMTLLFTAIQIGCMVLALVIMPWEASDEPLRTSFAHAFRRVWLHTTQAVSLVVLGGVPIAYMDHLRWLFFTSPRYTSL